MEKSLDQLIKHLLAEIALCGPSGESILSLPSLHLMVDRTVRFAVMSSDVLIETVLRADFDAHTTRRTLIPGRSVVSLFARFEDRLRNPANT